MGFLQDDEGVGVDVGHQIFQFGGLTLFDGAEQDLFG